MTNETRGDLGARSSHGRHSPSAIAEGRLRPRWVWLPATLLLAAHAALAVAAVYRTSLTVDEFAHLPAGVSYWETGHFSTYHHNPPLVKLLAAVPVVLSGGKTTYDSYWHDAQTGGYSPSHFSFGLHFMRNNRDRYMALFNRARCVIVGISVVGGVFVFLWARRLGGDWAGLLALVLWCFCPNVLAHAGLITTDMGGTVAGFVATYFFWRYLHSPSGWRAGVAGALLGVAQLTKFSLLPLYFIWPVLWAISGIGYRVSGMGFRGAAVRELPASKPETPNPKPQTRNSERQTPHPKLVISLAHGGLMLLASLLVINAGYGFEGSLRPLGKFEFLSRSLTRPRTSGEPLFHPEAMYAGLYRERQNRFQDSWLAAVPSPLPAEYLLGFDEQRFEAEGGPAKGQGYQVYLNGEMRRTGWWYYYLYALAVKVPLGTWALVILSLVLRWFVPGLRRTPADEAVIWLPAVAVLFSMSFFTDIDLGLRYVLPLLPFVFMGVSSLARVESRESRVESQKDPSGRGGSRRSGRGRRRARLTTHRSAVTWLVVAAVTWNVYSGVIAIHPHYLASFNELVGGPERGRFHLIDSNLDWGQDLFELRRWLDRHPRGGPLGLAYFGSMDPKLAGIENYYVPPLGPCPYAAEQHLPPQSLGPMPGLYAVSVNLERGLQFRAPASLANAPLAFFPQDAFGYFRYFSPMARAGYSILIYDIYPDEVNRVRSALGLPPLAATP